MNIVAKQDAADIIVDCTIVMVAKLATAIEADTNYPKQELLEAVIKKLNNIL